MLRQVSHELAFSTSGRGLIEITGEVVKAIKWDNWQNGLVTLHLQHTSASLLIQENADREVRRDLERFFSRLVPDGDPLFRHTSEGPDDMPAHVKAMLNGVSLHVPVTAGKLALGTWQGIYLIDHRRRPHNREIIFQFIGGR